MRVKYTGPHTDGVTTIFGSVLPGETLEVPDGTDLGGDFEAEKAKTKKESD